MKSQNKIALITGANRGIGFETARALSEKGIHVLLGCREKVKGEKAAQDIATMGFKATPFVLDIKNSSDFQKIYQFIEKEFGVLDILINNAGVWLDSPDASKKNPNQTSTTSLKIIRDTFDANFFGVIELTQTLLPLIRQSSAGRIVNLSSILGSQALHADPQSPIYESKAFAYNASKVALNTYTIHLAHELKNTKIKVNSAHPGWVKTEMGGASAPMSAKDGAKTSVLLALLPDDGPTGGFYHLNEKLPW